MRNKRTVAGAALVAAITMGTMLVSAATASATPGNCTINYSLPSAVCTSGTGHYYVDAVVTQGSGGFVSAVSGPVVSIGQVSVANTNWSVLNDEVWVEFTN